MSQSLAQVYLHIIFSTKNREPHLADAWQGDLFGVLGAASDNLACPAMTVGGVADPVHMLVRLARTVTVAGLVGQVKTLSSLWVNQTRGLVTPFRWQGGYSAFSVSHSKVGTVREYIRKQPEHHATKTCQDGLREWLTQYEVEYDERHVWD